MARKTDIPGRIVEAALSLAATRDWRGISLADIATAGELSLAQVLGVVGGKTDVLALHLRHIDATVAAGTNLADLGQPAQERLFDVLMRRFDALRHHRDAVRGIRKGLCRDPLAAACAGPALLRSMAAMLECAGLSSDGLGGLLRAKGLAVIYLATLGVWLDDDSDDLATTMAALDKRLGRADRLLRSVCRCARRPAPASAAPASAAPASAAT